MVSKSVSTSQFAVSHCAPATSWPRFPAPGRRSSSTAKEAVRANSIYPHLHPITDSNATSCKSLSRLAALRVLPLSSAFSSFIRSSFFKTPRTYPKTLQRYDTPYCSNYESPSTTTPNHRVSKTSSGHCAPRFKPSASIWTRGHLLINIEASWIDDSKPPRMGDNSPSPIPDLNRNRLPTLFEVLSRRTLPPVDLFSFYIFMRDQQRSVDYLDFWCRQPILKEAAVSRLVSHLTIEPQARCCSAHDSLPSLCPRITKISSHRDTRPRTCLETLLSNPRKHGRH